MKLQVNVCLILFVTAAFGQKPQDDDDIIGAIDESDIGSPTGVQNRSVSATSTLPTTTTASVACVKLNQNSWTPERDYLKNKNGDRLQIEGRWAKTRCIGRTWDVAMFIITQSAYNELISKCKSQGFDTAQPWKEVGRLENSDDWFPFLVDGNVTDHYWYQRDEHKHLRCPTAPLEKCGLGGTWSIACGRKKEGSSQPERQWLKDDRGYPLTVSGENVHKPCPARGWTFWLAKIDENDYSNIISKCRNLGYQTAQPTGATKDWSAEGWHPFQVGNEVKEHFWFHWYKGVYEYSGNVSMSVCGDNGVYGNFPATPLVTVNNKDMDDDDDDIEKITTTAAPRLKTWYIACAKSHPKASPATAPERQWLKDDNGNWVTYSGISSRIECPFRGQYAQAVGIFLNEYNGYVKKCQNLGFTTAQPSETPLDDATWYAFKVDGTDLSDHYYRGNIGFKRMHMTKIEKC